MGPIPQEVVESFDQRKKLSYNLNCTCKVRNGMGPIPQEVVSKSFLTALVSYMKVNFHNAYSFVSRYFVKNIIQPELYL